MKRYIKNSNEKPKKKKHVIYHMLVGDTLITKTNWHSSLDCYQRQSTNTGSIVKLILCSKQCHTTLD